MEWPDNESRQALLICCLPESTPDEEYLDLVFEAISSPTVVNKIRRYLINDGKIINKDLKETIQKKMPQFENFSVAEWRTVFTNLDLFECLISTLGYHDE